MKLSEDENNEKNAKQAKLCTRDTLLPYEDKCSSVT